MMRLFFTAIVVAFAIATDSAQAARCTADVQRLVSIDSALTEIVYALDAGDCLVAVDTTSTFPPQAQELPNVGYLRALSAEGILSLQTDHIIATQDAGPPEIIVQIQRARIPFTLIDAPYNTEGLYQKITAVGGVLGKDAAAKSLISQIQTKLADLTSDSETRPPPRVMFVMNQSGNNLQVAGHSTRAQALIELAGGVNVINHFRGYRPLALETALQLQPDIILVLANEAPERFIQHHPVLSLTHAVQQERGFLLAQDDLAFGPRLPDVLEKLQVWFYE